MVINEKKILDHLDGVFPKEGYLKTVGNHSRYLLALEAWRRGIKVTFYRDEKGMCFSLEYGKKKHDFRTSFGDLTSDEAIKITENKALTKQYLQEAGLPIAKGETFDESDSIENIIHYATNLDFPLVIKPVDGIQGRGVVANIQTIEEFREALVHVREKLGYLDIIVEEHINGDEMRVFFLENQVIAAYKKEPAFVIGDGMDTIENLINIKNQERRENPHLFTYTIKKNNALIKKIKQSGFTLDSVLDKDLKLYLRTQSNISLGGEFIDCTDDLPENIISTAKEVHRVIPNLPHGGIDLIVNENDEGIILEINHNAGLGTHVFPSKGKPRDLPKLMINYYFPETKDIKRSPLYFNYKTVLGPIKDRLVQMVVLPQLQTENIYSKKYIVTGKVQKVGYRNWIRRQALNASLHGYVKNLRNSKVEIVVAGNDPIELDNFKAICSKGSKRARVKNVIERSWDKPVPYGFTILDSIDNPDYLKHALKTEKAKRIKAVKRLKRIEKKYNSIINSRSWKLLQKIKKLLRK